MPVQWQLIEVPLGSVDKFTNAEHVLPGRLDTALNVRFRAPPALAKRYGWTLLNGSVTSPVPTIGTVRRLIGHEKELLLCDDRNLYSYSVAADRFRDRGNLSDCHLTRRQIMHDQGRNFFQADMAIVGDVCVVAWGGANNTCQGVVIDLNTNAIVSAITSTTGGAPQPGYVRPVAAGNYIVLVAWSAGGTLVYKTLDTTSQDLVYGTGAWATLSMSSGMDPGAMFDVAESVGGSSEFYVAYKSAAGTGLTACADLFAVGGGGTIGLPSASLDTGLAMDEAIAIEGVQGENAYLVFADSASGLTCKRLNATTLAVAGTTIPTATLLVQKASIAKLTSTKRIIIWKHPAAGSAQGHSRYVTVTNADAVGTTKNLPDWEPMSKPWVVNGRAHATVIFQSDDQPTFAVVELTDDNGDTQSARWLGTAARGLAAMEEPSTEISGFLHSVYSRSTGVLEHAGHVKYRFRFSGASDDPVIIARSGVSKLTWDFANRTRHCSAPWGKGRFIAGARPTWYDGHTSAEHQFSTRPEDDRYSSATETGGSVWTPGAGAIVNYVFVHEHEDSLGNITRSAPSEVFTWTIGSVGQRKLQHTINETLLTARSGLGGTTAIATDARVVPYRTQINPTSTSPYYRDSTLGFAATSTTVAEVGVEFNETDIALQDVLYITGDILDNAGTPPCKVVVYHNERLYLGGTEEPTWVWFSQPFAEGEQPRFNEALRFNVGDEVTALASFQEALFVLSERRLFRVDGSGPPATGGLDLGYLITEIPTPEGCIDWRSICVTDHGCYFSGKRGPYRINPDGQSVTWMGAALKSVWEASTETVAVLHDQPNHEIVWFIRRPSTNVAVRLVYNYSVVGEDGMGFWTHDSTPYDVQSAAVAWQGSETAGKYRLHQATTASTAVSYQGDAVTPDSETGTTYPGTQIVTPWFKLNTLQGWFRTRKMRLLGRFNADHGLTIEVGYPTSGGGYGTLWTIPAHTWTAAELAALNYEQVEVALPEQKAPAVRFRITETGTGVDGYTASTGPEYISIVLEAGFKTGFNRTLGATAHRR